MTKDYLVEFEDSVSGCDGHEHIVALDNSRVEPKQGDGETYFTRCAATGNLINCYGTVAEDAIQAEADTIYFALEYSTTCENCAADFKEAYNLPDTEDKFLSRDIEPAEAEAEA